MTTETKERVLEQLGWKVISIPYFLNENYDAPTLQELLRPIHERK